MDLLQISKYFTKDTLEDIIRKAGGNKFVSYSFEASFNKGDSYLSEIYRVKVFGTKNENSPIEVSLIVKAMPKNLARRKLFRSVDFFHNEILFYSKIIPAFETFQKQKQCPNPFKEYPKCYAYYSDHEHDFIALEDVSIYGFRTSTRLQETDLEHCEIIMKALGRFHAVSLAFKDQMPAEFKQLLENTQETYFAEQYRQWYTPFLKTAVKVANDSVSKEYGGTVYETKVKEFTADNLYTKLVQMVHATNQYSVIGHGDCWPPNFLMKYREENGETIPQEITIIDFQLARYGSPALDLSFFVYSCLKQDLRDQHYERILKIYHENACALIQDLGSDPEKVFPFSALLTELKEFGKFGLGMSIEAIPLTIIDESDIADLDEIDDENATLTDVWKIGPIPTKEGRLRLASIFKHAVDNGYIE